MIDTGWPSSRRLAMRPPHESATSSGWGATKTWVMAGRVYRARWSRRVTLGEATGPDQRHEHARPVGRLRPIVPMPLDEHQDLLVTWADRDHETAAVGGELRLQLDRDGRRRRGDDDPVERRIRGRPETAVRAPDLDPVADAWEPVEPDARLGREVVVPLEGEHPSAHRREDRGLVPGACPDLQDPVVLARVEELGHLGDDVRLADGLAGIDRQRLVRIRAAFVALLHEPVARDQRHRREDAWVADAARAQLALDHAPPVVCRAHAGIVTPGHRCSGSGRPDGAGGSPQAIERSGDRRAPAGRPTSWRWDSGRRSASRTARGSRAGIRSRLVWTRS